jgi:hypothetical protein
MRALTSAQPVCAEQSSSGDYWEAARQPLTSLLFLAPLLVGYELAAVAFAGAAVPRNGADAWLRGWFQHLGLGVPWILPMVVGLTLLGWHFIRRQPVCLEPSTFFGMLGESLLFALLLVLCGQGLHAAMNEPLPSASVEKWTLTSMQARVLSSVGAGLYEEYLFRLLLVPAILGTAALIIRWELAAFTAVAISSVIFAVAHYLPPGESALSPAAYITSFETVWNEPCLWYGFAFRGLAGIVFGSLFVLRGFGVTVGAHACYDVLVGLMESITAE